MWRTKFTECRLVTQTAEYGKCTPVIFFLKYHCTSEKGHGTVEFWCGSIVEAFILPQWRLNEELQKK